MADAAASTAEPLRHVAEERVPPDEIDARLKQADAPFVVRGLIADWPLVKAGLESAAAARAYLLGHQRDRAFTVNIGEPGSGDRLFYDEAMGMNFRTGRAALAEIFAGIDANEGKRDAPAIYLSSIDVEGYFDGLHEANHLDLGDRQPIESIWIGTQTRVAAHNDFPNNLACCAVGRRRFTLFPPDQFPNLYVGPVDFTPAGRPVSMVDLRKPDFDAFPCFREALKTAQAAELEPGDAIFIPSMWWHHVEALASFNVLVNYWWRDTPRFLAQPQDALNHALLAIRDLPEDEKKLWGQMFDYYVFGDPAAAAAHIPEKARGILAPLDAEQAGRIRANLLRSLSR
ncbi:cupin-like domain-containing protein [Sphingomonas sp. URHD0057]|uniref:cupin-like domain-containing protein n=1 Tax=Sphingomonas sp. URHD0057 TaxID=1380389 RepID=UPI00055F31DF|nr:cupin-like domain-containing protein [Sphingomonas sp. URHD0057]